jgi:pSer/pThr/pTyr-binding forkhead associated (FHA) protein
MAGPRIGQTHEFPEPRTLVNKPLKGFRARPQRAHALEQRSGPGAPHQYVLEGDLSIGRAVTADVVLESEDVSRTHARLTRADDEYSIEDAGSRNGVFLNGVQVHAAVLRDGDEVQLGDCLFTYHEGA